MTVLTHCNTGSLATSGHGTALGIIRDLWKSGQLAKAYCTETRPYNQGSRLTAYELVYEGIPAGFICDSAAAALMQNKVGATSMMLSPIFRLNIFLFLELPTAFCNVKLCISVSRICTLAVKRTESELPRDLESNVQAPLLRLCMRRCHVLRARHHFNEAKKGFSKSSSSPCSCKPGMILHYAFRWQR